MTIDERNEIIEMWKNRQIKAKDIFLILEISKSVAYDFVKQYHYLKDAKFFSCYSYGLWLDGELVGVATYSNPQGTSSLKGWFGLPNTDQTVLELSRLCLLPDLNNTNASSYLLGNSLKLLKREGIRAVITLADSSRHIGSIYQVCNFKYYGLTDSKCDFYQYPDCKKNVRGATHNKRGVWIPRSRKHRYAYILDKKLKVLYEEQPHPTIKETTDVFCCGGTNIVHDNRFDEYFTCPICSRKLMTRSEYLDSLLSDVI